MPEARAHPYHHGDLRAALVRAGYGLALDEGPQAVTLRAVTRRAGVSATAAYRHFANVDQLRAAVGMRALGALAGVIEAHQAALPAAHRARPRDLLTAVGDGYIAYALDNPNGFRTGLFGLLDMGHAELPEGAGDGGRTPFQLLTDALAAAAAQGSLPPDSVSSAAVHCWSSVHGFASLALLGPLRGQARHELDALGRRLVRDVVAGVLGPAS